MEKVLTVRAFSKMVDGLPKTVEPLHIFEDPTQKMVVGKRIFSLKNLLFWLKKAPQNSTEIFVTLWYLYFFHSVVTVLV